MTKRLILAVLFLTLGFLSLLPVLYVNNGFDLVEYGSKKSLGAPRIDVHVEDPCNSVKYVTATAEVTPFQSNFTVQSFPTEHPTCGEPAGAIVTLVDLALQLEGDTIDPSEFRPMKPHPNVTRGTLQRVPEEFSGRRFPLGGKGYDPQIVFKLAPDALEVGFGESALQVEVSTRNLRCPDTDSDPQIFSDYFGADKCLIPLQGALLYAASAFDLASAIPPVDRLMSGPNLGEFGGKDGDYYATTRLVWSGQVQPPSNLIRGAAAGFEFHLLERHSVALQLCVTVAFSAVFGTFISMLFGLFQDSRVPGCGGKHDGPAAGSPKPDAPIPADSINPTIAPQPIPSKTPTPTPPPVTVPTVEIPATPGTIQAKPSEEPPVQNEAHEDSQQEDEKPESN